MPFTSFTANQQCSVGQRNDMTSDVSLLSVQAPAKGPTGQHQAPVLSVAWHGDCTRYFSGSADQTVKMWSAQAPGQSQDVGKHNGAVTHICVPNTNHGCSLPGGVGAHCVISAGADNVIKYWDIRQKRQIAEVRMNGKVACMDLRGDLLVAACRDPNNPKNQNLQIFHLSKPQQVYRTLKSPLTHQIMSLSCFPDQKGTVYTTTSFDSLIRLPLLPLLIVITSFDSVINKNLCNLTSFISIKIFVT